MVHYPRLLLLLKASFRDDYDESVYYRVIAYRTGGVYFLEGCTDSPLSSTYTNLAILVKCEDQIKISRIIKEYRERFGGVPIIQRFDDYEYYPNLNPESFLAWAKSQEWKEKLPTLDKWF